MFRLLHGIVTQDFQFDIGQFPYWTKKPIIDGLTSIHFEIQLKVKNKKPFHETPELIDLFIHFALGFLQFPDDIVESQVD